MKLLALCTIALSCLVSVPAEKRVYDEVVPFPEVLPTTTENKVALKFKPQLHISSGCHPYPAVDADGNTNAGLGITKVFTSCEGSPQGSQVYGRMTEYEGVVAIMYAWYFPREFMVSPVWVGHRHDWEHAIVWLDGLGTRAEVLAVTVQQLLGYKTYKPPKAKHMDGSSAKIKYTWLIQTQHYLSATTEAGEFQDLIMWENMTAAAQEALEDTKFFWSWAPINEGQFQDNIEKAYPFN
ncbi:NPP1-like protein [Phytophthora infestans T30-4]|uniref:NPP1-like protein n=1 Tax=Phytophthora infestans (strain T30-4) TaxID=403677 RepID=D0NU99_PHYIT|nr:NPP1-like protein [Phytophthora infestans T30-4]EEY65232.1 NPP1-like protein [Phytophthora infestans T30-4]|eukprot:XP_002897296.1 NPP1-like protein [Phytophthora infestans T30-4]